MQFGIVCSLFSPYSIVDNPALGKVLLMNTSKGWHFQATNILHMDLKSNNHYSNKQNACQHSTTSHDLTVQSERIVTTFVQYQGAPLNVELTVVLLQI